MIIEIDLIPLLNYLFLFLNLIEMDSKWFNSVFLMTDRRQWSREDMHSIQIQ